MLQSQLAPLWIRVLRCGATNSLLVLKLLACGTSRMAFLCQHAMAVPVSGSDHKLETIACLGFQCLSCRQIATIQLDDL